MQDEEFHRPIFTLIRKNRQMGNYVLEGDANTHFEGQNRFLILGHDKQMNKVSM